MIVRRLLSMARRGLSTKASMSSQALRATPNVSSSPSAPASSTLATNDPIPSTSSSRDAVPNIATTSSSTTSPMDPPPVPKYLSEVYWWAYVHPNSVRVFERHWLVNLILWGNFRRLRDAALAEVERGSVDGQITGEFLQVACVYGDFTQEIVRRLSPTASLSVLDVSPVQITNLRRKLHLNDVHPQSQSHIDAKHSQIHLHQEDASEMSFDNAEFHTVMLFMLLHEMPAEVREKTLREAFRVLKPGGRLVIVDYHKPVAYHPLFAVMTSVLRLLEPFALDLWSEDVRCWFPKNERYSFEKETFFGGLYQKVVVTKNE